MALPKDLREDEPKKPVAKLAAPTPQPKIQFNPFQKTQASGKTLAPAYGTSIKIKFKNFGAKARRLLGHEKSVLLLIVIMLALAMGAVGSGLTGAVLSGGAGGEEDLTAQLIACQTNNTILLGEKTALESTLGSYKDLNSQLSSQVDDYSDTIKTRDTSVTECQDELSSTKSSLSDAQSDLTRAQATLEDTRDELDGAQANFDAMAENYANRYCCQLRVLGFNYNAYAAVDNNVVCLTSGEKLINCTV